MARLSVASPSAAAPQERPHHAARWGKELDPRASTDADNRARRAMSDADYTDRETAVFDFHVFRLHRRVRQRCQRVLRSSRTASRWSPARPASGQEPPRRTPRRPGAQHAGRVKIITVSGTRSEYQDRGHQPDPGLDRRSGAAVFANARVAQHRPLRDRTSCHDPAAARPSRHARIAPIQPALTATWCCRRCTPTTPPASIARIAIADMGVEDYHAHLHRERHPPRPCPVRRLGRRHAEKYPALARGNREVGLRTASSQYGEVSMHCARPSALSADRLPAGRTTIMRIPGDVIDELRCAVMRRRQANWSSSRATPACTMYGDGIAKTSRGETTIEEVLRVTGDMIIGIVIPGEAKDLLSRIGDMPGTAQVAGCASGKVGSSNAAVSRGP